MMICHNYGRRDHLSYECPTTRMMQIAGHTRDIASSLESQIVDTVKVDVEGVWKLRREKKV